MLFIGMISRLKKRRRLFLNGARIKALSSLMTAKGMDPVQTSPRHELMPQHRFQLEKRARRDFAQACARKMSQRQGIRARQVIAQEKHARLESPAIMLPFWETRAPKYNGSPMGSSDL